MRYIRRRLESQVLQAVKRFPTLVLTGPRRAGKTLLLRRLFPNASYFLLEDPDVVARLRADPQGFLDAVPTPAILDEVQNVPEVFAFVRSRIDRRPRRVGQWLLTSSQESPLMQGVTESMAGRAAVGLGLGSPLLWGGGVGHAALGLLFVMALAHLKERRSQALGDSCDFPSPLLMFHPHSRDSGRLSQHDDEAHARGANPKAGSDRASCKIDRPRGSRDTHTYERREDRQPFTFSFPRTAPRRQS